MENSKRLLLAIFFCWAVFQPQEWAWAKNSPLYKEHEILIKIRLDALSSKKLQEIHQQLGAKARSPFKIFKQFQVVTLPPEVKLEEALTHYKSFSEVEFTEPHYLYRALLSDIKDPLFKEQWGLQNTGQRGGKVGADIGAPAAWPHLQNNREIIVAIIDTGVDLSHIDLKENLWSNEGEIPLNSLDDDGNGFVDDVHGYNFYSKNADPQDDHMHGTHCAGIIGAKHNEEGLRGVAPFVKLMPVKFLGPLGDGDLENAILAIEYALLNGAHIMNNSWGGPPYSQALNEVIKEVSDRGVLFVAAAGNDHSNNDTDPTYPASYKHPLVLSVGASTVSDEIAPFSNWGKDSVHLMAPGQYILSTVLGGNYQTASGTSMAAPMVSGAAAALMAHYPEWSAQDVRERLLQTVTKTNHYAQRSNSRGRLHLFQAFMGDIMPEPPADTDWTHFPTQLSSPHPYPSMANLKWKIEHPGARFIKLHFRRLETEKRVDFVALRDRQGQVIETLNGNQGSLWSRVIPGDSVEIQLRSDSINSFFGFEIDSYSIKN